MQDLLPAYKIRSELRAYRCKQPSGSDAFLSHPHVLSNYKCYLLELPNDRYCRCQLLLFTVANWHMIFYSRCLQHPEVRVQPCWTCSRLDRYFLKSINTEEGITNCANTYGARRYVLSCPIKHGFDPWGAEKAQTFHKYFIIPGIYAWLD